MKKNEKVMEDAALKVVAFAAEHPEASLAMGFTEAVLKEAKKRRRAKRVRCSRVRYKGRRRRGLLPKLFKGY